MITEALRRQIINSFEPHFVVTWESARQVVNTQIYVMLLKPARQTSETFGFENEVPLFISTYPTVQPRSMQAIEQICAEHPLSGRIDTTVAFFYSPDSSLDEWVSRYQSENPESRITVPFSSGIINTAIDDKWAIPNKIKEVLFIRNLFDYKLPLKSDRYFYGREDIVASIIDNVKKSQNSAIFGLRKTGKTSVLLKAQRSLKRSGEVTTLFIDCKSRPIRGGTCDDLALRIIEFIDREFSQKNSARVGTYSDVLEALDAAIRAIPRRQKLCIIFDEIEYISPLSPTDGHWAKDFIDLWQALWTTQSTCDKVSYIVCGVNPTICEVDRFPSATQSGRTVQNPMFSIFNIHSLRGLPLGPLENMIQFFGSRMGLNFQKEAIEKLFCDYGGHPLLTRLACSFHHDELSAKGEVRPITIRLEDLVKSQTERDAELSAYCGHVISEIEELYPKEYRLLRDLASGEVADFFEATQDQSTVRHIRDYGLVHFEKGLPPRFNIPVVQRYLRHKDRLAIALEEANRFPNGAERRAWLARRSRAIAEDLCLLDSELRDIGGRCIYPSANSFNALKFCEMPLVETEDDFVSFLVHAHKHVVEPIDKFWKSGVARNKEFEKGFPALKKSLMRLKSFRNMHCHVDVSSETEEGYLSFIREDFDGSSPDSIPDGWFRTQRLILDHMHVGLQLEISAL